MDEYEDLSHNDNVSSREAGIPSIRPKREPKVDEEISKIAGKKVMVNDPNLIKMVVKYDVPEAMKDENYNVMKDPRFIKDIRKFYGRK